MAERPAAASLVLEARGIRAGYGQILALDDVYFGVPRGSVVTLLGSNGAGKSTLLRVLAGGLLPWRGQVFFDGEPVTGRRPWDLARLGICTVPEGSGLFHDLTVRENLVLGQRLGTKEPAAIEEAFDLFPVLGRRQRQRAGSLSGGEKRMLALSRAVLTRPRLLLVDEPSLGLAPKVVDEVFDVLRHLNTEAGLSIVLVEQYVSRALDIAHWAWVLTKGRVSYSGEAEGLRDPGVLDRAYLGAAGAVPSGSPATA